MNIWRTIAVGLGGLALARLWVGLSTLAGVLGALVLVLRLTRLRQS